ncbi:MAG: hypothetical protein NZ519_09645 [Bacteroidia bacterium]|nr:hypothetical protein [Bacteroidia bacterium]
MYLSSFVRYFIFFTIVGLSGILYTACSGQKKENKKENTVQQEQPHAHKDTVRQKIAKTVSVDTSKHQVHHIVNKELADALHLGNEGIELANKGKFAAAMVKWEECENKCSLLEKDEKVRKELEAEKSTRSKILCNYAAAAIRINQNLEKAIKYLEKSTQINPEYANAYMLLGDIYTLLGDKTEAQANYKKFLSMPNISEAEKDLAERKLSGSINNFVVEINQVENPQTVREKKERLDKYHRDAQRFIKNNETKKAIIALNMYEETCTEYEKSGYLRQHLLTELAKQRAENLMQLVNLSLKSGKTLVDMRKHIEKATQIDPENAEVWIKMGDLSAVQFDKSAAKEAYIRAQKCKLSPEQKQYIEEKLKLL